jgi:hypothetical protein
MSYEGTLLPASNEGFSHDPLAALAAWRGLCRALVLGGWGTKPAREPAAPTAPSTGPASASDVAYAAGPLYEGMAAVDPPMRRSRRRVAEAMNECHSGTAGRHATLEGRLKDQSFPAAAIRSTSMRGSPRVTQFAELQNTVRWSGSPAIRERTLRNSR